jgi:hypothetical protein
VRVIKVIAKMWDEVWKKGQMTPKRRMNEAWPNYEGYGNGMEGGLIKW